MLACEVQQPVPNLKKYTEEEILEITYKWYDLLEAGNEEEAERVSDEIPILPELAQALKEQRGIHYVISSGLNLSKAVEAYGKEWLER